MKYIVKYLLLFLIVTLISSCSPKFSIIPDEAKEYYAEKETREEQFKKGFKEGKDACRKEMIDSLYEEIIMLKNIKEYNELIQGGFLKPPRLVNVVVPAQVLEGGKKLQAPRMEWIIVDDARFETKSIVERLLSQKYFVLFGIYDKKEDAESIISNFSKRIDVADKDNLVFKIIATTSMSYALVMETQDKSIAEKYEKMFRGQRL